MSSVQVSLVRVPAKGFAGLLPLALGEADEDYIEDTWTITATGNEESTTFVCPPAEFGRFAWRIVIDGDESMRVGWMPGDLTLVGAQGLRLLGNRTHEFLAKPGDYCVIDGV